LEADCGGGRWEGTEVGALARQIKTTERARQEAVWRSNALSASRGDVRAAKREIKQADARLDDVRPRYEKLAEPQRVRINRSIGGLEQEQNALQVRVSDRRQWIAEHPEVTRRLGHLDTELDVINRALGVARGVLDGIERVPERPQRSIGVELFDAIPPTTPRQVQRAPEPDLGLGLYWRPVWHVLEEQRRFELMLVNARHVKNLPGRKTDAGDAAWLAQLLECGLLRGSFIPTKEMSRLRDLTRYRTKLTQERTREIQRVQKLLEDANVKLDSVITDIMGKSAREMLDALIAGNTDVEAMAQMARTRMRPKIPELRLALEGRFDDHHRLMLRMHLHHIDDLTAMIGELDAKIDELMAPFDEPATRLLTIPGVGKRTVETIVAEIGVDMSRFPTPGHLASWAGLCPGNDESAGKRRSGKARKGNEALRTAMCEAAWAASHTRDTYLSAQYRSFKRRMGTKSEGRAIFAVAHTMIVIVWHVLHDDTTYNELGADYFDKRKDTNARQRHLIRELEKLGNTVTIEPAAA